MRRGTGAAGQGRAGAYGCRPGQQTIKPGRRRPRRTSAGETSKRRTIADQAQRTAVDAGPRVIAEQYQARVMRSSGRRSAPDDRDVGDCPLGEGSRLFLQPHGVGETAPRLTAHASQTAWVRCPAGALAPVARLAASSSVRMDETCPSTDSAAETKTQASVREVTTFCSAIHRAPPGHRSRDPTSRGRRTRCWWMRRWRSTPSVPSGELATMSPANADTSLPTATTDGSTQASRAYEDQAAADDKSSATTSAVPARRSASAC